MIYNYGQLFKWSSGKSTSPSGGNIPIYGSNGIVGYTNEYKYHNKIIIGRVGTCGSVMYCKHNFNATDNTLITECNEELIDYVFAFYMLKTANLNSFAGGSAQPLLTQRILKHLKVDLPPLPVQSRIASILSAYDALIEKNNRKIAILQEMAQELFKEWFVRYRFPGHENARFENGLPKGWEIKKIQDFGKIETGKTPSMEIEDNYGEDVLFVKTPDMHGNFFVFDTEQKLSEKGHKTQPRKLIPKNSIMVSCIGTAGVVAINKKPAHTNQQINSIILRNINHLEWLFFVCKSLKDTIELFGATGATMTNLSKSKFEKLKIIYPSEEIIELFHNVVEPIFEKISVVNKQTLLLIKQRDILLPRLMSGKINIEP